MIKVIHIIKDYEPPDFKASAKTSKGEVPRCYFCRKGLNCRDHIVQSTGEIKKHGSSGLIGSIAQRKRYKRKNKR